MNEIIVESLTLKELFDKQQTLAIPEYQRPYVWTPKEINKLLAQLKQHQERTDEKPLFYLGSIVLFKNQKNDLEIIDGQQRLTTLTILFSVLVSNLTGKARESCNALLQESGNIFAGIPARPRIPLRQRDQAFFNKYIQEVQIPSLISIAATALSTEV